MISTRTDIFLTPKVEKVSLILKDRLDLGGGFALGNI